MILSLFGVHCHRALLLILPSFCSFCKWISFSLQAKDMWCSLSCRIALEIIRIEMHCEIFLTTISRSLSPQFDFIWMFRDHIFLHTFDPKHSIQLHSMDRPKVLALIRSFAVGILRNPGVNLDGPITLQKSLKINQKNATQRNKEQLCSVFGIFQRLFVCWRQFAIASYRYAPWLKMVCHICILLHSQWSAKEKNLTINSNTVSQNAPSIRVPYGTELCAFPTYFLLLILCFAAICFRTMHINRHTNESCKSLNGNRKHFAGPHLIYFHGFSERKKNK